jgi:hypothetical protein
MRAVKLWVSFALLGATLLLPCHLYAERGKGMRFLASDVGELNENGIYVKLSELNRNRTEEGRAGNLSATILIAKNTPLPISQVEFALALPRSARTAVPIHSIDSRDGKKYSFSISACDLDRAKVYIWFDFPGNYSEAKYYYYIELSSFAEARAQTDKEIYEFMNTRQDVCKELGIEIKAKSECIE